MKLTALLLCLPLSACLSTSSGVDLAEVARQVGLVRMDVESFAYLGTPATQEKIAKLAFEVKKVEAALNAAAKGGPVDGVASAAQAALVIASSLVQSEPGESDLRFYLALAEVVLRHLAAGEPEEVPPAVEAAVDA